MSTEEKLEELRLTLSQIESSCKNLKSEPFRKFADYVNIQAGKVSQKEKELPKVKELESAGVYVLYDGDEICYVGSAGSNHTVRYRIKDLFAYNESYEGKSERWGHNLTWKLMRDVENKHKISEKIDDVRDFYFKCRFKFIKAKEDADAHAIEQVLIMLFKPKYNGESDKKNNSLQS